MDTTALNLNSGTAQQSEADVEQLEFQDYYQLLDVRPGSSDLQLLRHFLRHCRKAMAERDEATLLKIRQGFEVLRYEDTRISYFRMHRLLIRKEPMRFPIPKQREMLQDIRSKMALANGQTSPVIEPGSTYFKLELKVLTGIMLLDLSNLLYFGASGTLLLVALPILVIANEASWLSIIIASPMALWGLFVLKRCASDYVTYPTVSSKRSSL